MLAFEYPIRPFTFGPRSSPFFAMPYLAVGGVGLAWAGVAGRWARRHAAPAVVGRFIFFSRLGLFWRFGAFGFWASRTTDDDETGLPPLNPLVLRTENRQFFIANFFGDFKTRSHDAAVSSGPSARQRPAAPDSTRDLKAGAQGSPGSPTILATAHQLNWQEPKHAALAVHSEATLRGSQAPTLEQPWFHQKDSTTTGCSMYRACARQLQ